ncbi:linear amide C-N hydrolase [Yersinia massiliensis]|uniref:linear amide C-N hydrolase n=1 Tax=Yersinia massiliensis TaxID=419257 RepID=UPI0011A3B389|nr:linear amide C-N hydrolase [Yersinia massiliensis]
MNKNRISKILFGVMAFVGTITLIPTAQACTRAVYLGPEDLVITARSMDWKEDLHSDLWIFPRGMERTGNAGPNSVVWTSKYGSVITAAYNIASTDGMNEKGLVVNMLWLAESQYPTPTPDKPNLSLAAWGQYVLDNFATVDEAVKTLRNEPITVLTSKVPGQERLGTIHLTLSDPSGDSAVFEYIDGKLTIHHSREYQVVTNSPTYDKQLAIDSYWQRIGGTNMLPGTNSSSDRFVRAQFYINAIPKYTDKQLATASVLSVIRSVSVPYGISTPDEPNISSTRWRTLSDQKNKIYYFESTLMPNTFWVDFNKVDFSKSAEVKKLKINTPQAIQYTGDVSAHFQPAKPFVFEPVTPSV